MEWCNMVITIFLGLCVLGYVELGSQVYKRFQECRIQPLCGSEDKRHVSNFFIA